MRKNKKSNKAIASVKEELSTIHTRLEKIEQYLWHNVATDPMSSLPHASAPVAENPFWIVFRQQHPGFIPRLRTLIPQITQGEEHLCMMIKRNMNIREMACMLNVDLNTVYTARARLKRKLPLDGDTTMDQWIKTIDNQ